MRFLTVGVAAVCGLALTACVRVELGTSEERIGPTGVSGYLLLADGSLHSAAGSPPAGLHARGRIVDGRFLPDGNVEGEGELGVDGHPGWMELADGSFHGDETGRPPFPPYVHGVMGDDGIFRPDSRTVVY